MDVTSYLGFAGYAIGVLSAIFAYVNRDRYKTLIRDIYEPGNKEAREQLASIRSETAALTAEHIALKNTIKEKEGHIKHLEELTLRLPDLTSLSKAQNEVIKVLSTNHKEVMQRITDLASKIQDSK